MKEYTHRAWFYKIPCFYNKNNDALWGRNRIYDFLLDIAIWFHHTFMDEQGFPVLIEKNKQDLDWEEHGS